MYTVYSLYIATSNSIIFNSKQAEIFLMKSVYSTRDSLGTIGDFGMNKEKPLGLKLVSQYVLILVL